jgi:hypothetical protein
MLFSTTVFRLVEIGTLTDSVSSFFLIFVPDSRLEQGHTLLVSPAYWVSSGHSGDFGAPDLEAKPLLALLTAIVLAAYWPPFIQPAACELESLGAVLRNSTPINREVSSETDAVAPGSCVSPERVRR